MAEHSATDTLCSPCHSLLEVIDTLEVGGHMEARLEARTATPEHCLESRRCRLCNILPDESKSVYHDVWADQTEAYISLTFRYQGLSGPPEPTFYKRTCEFLLYRMEHDNRMFDLCLKAAVEENTSSDAVLAVASEWLYRCSRHHAKCAPYQQQPRSYPSRLLDVRGNSSIRLVEKSTTRFQGPYATLSHS